MTFDTDNDGVPDVIDAFPNDPAASVDLDGDKYPDYWNPGKSRKDSTTGLSLDAFPNDPAASIDTDSDGYPEQWNPGKSHEDSTSGLELDEYTEDHDQEGNAIDFNNQIFKIILLIFLVIILILLGLSNVVYKRKQIRRIREPYIDDSVLKIARNEILHGRNQSDLQLSPNEIKLKLSENLERGEMSQETYQNIVNIIESENSEDISNNN